MPKLGLSLNIGSSGTSVQSAPVSDLTFAPPATLSNVAAYSQFQLTATSLSNLTITFQKVSGPCFVENGILYPTGNGTAVVRAVTSQQTIQRSITLSGITGIDSGVSRLFVVSTGAGEYYDWEQETYVCGSIEHNVYLTKQNSTTWTDGVSTISFHSTYWKYFKPDSCGDNEARVNSTNGNTIPTTGWYNVTNFSSISISIEKNSLTFTNLPSIPAYVNAGQTQSIAGVGLSYNSQSVNLPINIQTSGACSLTGTTLTYTTPSGNIQNSSVSFVVGESAFYNSASSVLSFGVRSNSAGAFIMASFGSPNINGQRFIQDGANLVTDTYVSGDWNTTSSYLSIIQYTGGFPFSTSRLVTPSNSVLAQINRSDNTSDSTSIIPNDYSSTAFATANLSRFYIVTKVATGLQPSTSLGLLISGINAQNNAFVDGLYLKKTSGNNVYYLARNGTRLESPAYSGSVWRFVKDSTTLNHSSTSNDTIPLIDWGSGVGIGQATSFNRYPIGVKQLYLSGLSFTLNSVNYTLNRALLTRTGADTGDFQSATLPSSDLYYRIQNTTGFVFIQNSGVSTFKQLGTISVTANLNTINLVSNWTPESGVTGDLFIEPPV